MKGASHLSSAFVASLFIVIATVAMADGGGMSSTPLGLVIDRRPIDVSDQLDLIRSKISNSVPIDDVTIVGRTLWEHDALVARQLIFESDAELVFTQRAFEKRAEAFVIASQILSKDPKHPGRITWEYADSTPITTKASRAPQGQNGVGDGASGAPGLPGAFGVEGTRGRDAPTLFLFVPDLARSQVIVTLDGRPGGDGGPGQDGGAGGAGARGESASQNAFDCKRGPQWGGSGGGGGPGGIGGGGGAGGHGGTLTVLSSTRVLDGVQLFAAGGEGGHGGPGGKGGPGGPGGPEGEAQLPWCRPAGRNGATGAVGKDAGNGADGTPGHTGELRFVQLSDELLQRIASDLGVRNCSFFGLYCH